MGLSLLNFLAVRSAGLRSATVRIALFMFCLTLQKPSWIDIQRNHAARALQIALSLTKQKCFLKFPGGEDSAKPRILLTGYAAMVFSWCIDITGLAQSDRAASRPSADSANAQALLG